MKLIARLLPAIALVLLCACAATVKQAYEGTRSESEIAIVESVGDVGFRIDRTIHNMRPTGYVERVNGMQVGSDTYGFPVVVKVLPGQVNLDIYCSLPYGSADPRAPVERRGYGLYGTTITYAKTTLSVELRAGKKYELRCETASGYKARAWVEEATR